MPCQHNSLWFWVYDLGFTVLGLKPREVCECGANFQDWTTNTASARQSQRAPMIAWVQSRVIERLAIETSGCDESKDSSKRCFLPPLHSGQAPRSSFSLTGLASAALHCLIGCFFWRASRAMAASITMSWHLAANAAGGQPQGRRFLSSVAESSLPPSRAYLRVGAD